MLPPLRADHRPIAPERFDLRFDVPAARRLARLSVDPVSAAVLVGDGLVDLRLGRWRWCTPLPNLASVELVRPAATGRLLGVRAGLRDRSLSLGASWCERVRLRFHRPVAGSGAWRRLRHPVAVLGVEDPHGLADLLRPHVLDHRSAAVAHRAAS